jgi:hypothetical protein
MRTTTNNAGQVVPLVQFVLWARHEQLKVGNKHPCVAGEQPMTDALLSSVDVFGTTRQSVILLIQELIQCSLQLGQNFLHPPVLVCLVCPC